jgi:drug/metabolite transporter (DMT)-like permease
MVFPALLIVTAFGANAVAIKVGLEGFGIYTLAASRFTLSVVVILAWVLITGRELSVPGGQRLPLLLISAIFTVQISLFYLGIGHTNASRVTLMVNLLPFLIMVMAHFTIPDDRITLRKATGILLGFTGITLMLAPSKLSGSGIQFGDFAVLITTLIWAGNTILIKKILPHLQPYQVVFYPLLFGIPFFWILAFTVDPVMASSQTPRVLVALLYQVLTGSMGFVLWNTLLRKYGAVSLHSLIFIMPVSGVYFSFLVLGEPINPVILATLVLLTAGIIITHVPLRFFPFHRGGL